MARLIVVLTVGLIAAQARADDIHLRNGRVLRGQIVTQDAHGTVIQVGPGQITLPASQIERIETGLSPLQTFNERASRLAPEDIEDWVSLALWAQERGLLTQTRQAWGRVLQIRPDHPLANAGLGRVRHNGQWMSHDQSQRARGLVQHQGEWVSMAERDAALRSKEALAEARRAEAESQARIREAEARARAAEAEAAAAERAASWPGPYSPGVFGSVVGSGGYLGHGYRPYCPPRQPRREPRVRPQRPTPPSAPPPAGRMGTVGRNR
jgi:hypothetical protein